MSKRQFVGLDVHKDTIVIAVAEEGQAEAVSLVTLPHDVPKVIKRLLKLGCGSNRIGGMLGDWRTSCGRGI